MDPTGACPSCDAPTGPAPFCGHCGAWTGRPPAVGAAAGDHREPGAGRPGDGARPTAPEDRGRRRRAPATLVAAAAALVLGVAMLTGGGDRAAERATDTVELPTDAADRTGDAAPPVGPGRVAAGDAALPGGGTSAYACGGGDDGCVRWRRRLGSATVAGVVPRGEGGVIAAVAPGDGGPVRLLGLDETGALDWQREEASAKGTRPGLTRAGDLVLLRLGSRVVARDAASGRRRWEHADAVPQRALLASGTRHDGAVVLELSRPGVATPRDGIELRALDAADGTPRWAASADAAAFTDTAVGVLVGDVVRWLDPADGRARWEAELPAGPEAPSPTSAGQAGAERHRSPHGRDLAATASGAPVVVTTPRDGSGRQDIRVLDPADGSLRSEPEGRLLGLPEGHTDLVVEGSDRVAGLTLDGSPVWRRRLAGEGRAVVEQGRLLLVRGGDANATEVVDAESGRRRYVASPPVDGRPRGLLGPATLLADDPRAPMTSVAVGAADGRVRWRVGMSRLYPGVVEGATVAAVADELLVLEHAPVDDEE